MRRDRHQRIALGIGAALSAGLFSIMPVAYGAPTGGTSTTANVNPVTDGVRVVPKDGNTTKNHVVNWDTFSVESNETVYFDGSTADNVVKNNNYLNLVNPANGASQIDGAIKGGNNVYIVNPQGVVFGEGSSVDVGSLYVSSRPLADVNTNNFINGGNPLSSVVETSLKAVDVVNMGTVQADSVFLEGNNIKFKVGDTSVEETAYNRVMLVNNENGWNNMNENLSGKNILTSDLDFSDKAYTPIGNATNKFTGAFDGQYHTVSGITISGGTYGGLFGYTLGGTIENIGVSTVNKDGDVVGGSITADHAGGIAGYADGTKFINVFNEGVTISTSAADETYAGGIVGLLKGGGTGENAPWMIENAYNTGAVSGDKLLVGGIAGYATSAKIGNVYNTGATTNGFVGMGSGNLINNAYTTCNNIGGELYNQSTNSYTITLVDKSKNSLTDYDTKLSGVSNKGGENTVWRIYEGQTLPLLRAFLKPVTVTYNYKHDTVSGTNSGKDIPEDTLTFNGSYVEVQGDPVYSNTVSDGKIFYNNTGDPDINEKTGVRNAGTKALFYSLQNGYDIIGGNVTIDKKEVSLKTGDTLDFSHVYNGTNVVTTEFQKAVADGKVSVDGIVNGSNVKLAYTGTAEFADKNASAEKKALTLQNGTAYWTLTGNDADNYTITGSGNVTAYGYIKKRKVYLNINKTPITKEYDGDSAVKNDTVENRIALSNESFAVGDTTQDYGIIGSENVTLSAIDNDNRYYVDKDGNKTVNAPAAKYVKYADVSLDDDNAVNANYVLMYKDSDNKDVEVGADNPVLINGSITPKFIDINSFSVKGDTKHSKVYDGNSSYKVDGNAEVNVENILLDRDIKDDQDNKIITFAFAGAGSHFVQEDGTTEAIDVSTAKKIAYAVTASTSDEVNNPLGNYKIGATEDTATVLSADTTYDVTGEGSITPRHLKIVLKNGDKIDKDYNQSAAVDDADLEIGGNHLVYAATDDGKIYKLVEGDETEPARAKLNVEAYYYKPGETTPDANVYRVNDEVAAKDVRFTITMSGTHTDNYYIEDADNGTLKLNGTGKINPKELTLKYKDVVKTYDTTAKLDSTTDAHVVNTDSMDGAVYVEGLENDEVSVKVPLDNAKFSGSNVGTWNITYDNLSLEGDQAGNYTIASTGVGTGKGKIEQATITMDDFKFMVDGVTREYDTTEKVGSTAGTFVKEHYVDLGHDQKLDFAYTINDAGTKFTSQGTSSNAIKDAGSKKNVQYTITITSNPLAGNDNYQLVFNPNQVYTFEQAGTITPKKVYATVNGAVTKLYDGTPTVKSGDTELTGDNLVTIHGKLDGTNTSVAAYIDSQDAANDAADHGTENKKVQYTVQLDDASAGNYAIYDDATYTTLASDSTKFTTSNNTISQRDTNLTFNSVTKAYDGTVDYGESTVDGDKAAYVFTDELAKSMLSITSSGDYDYKKNAFYDNENAGIATTVTYDNFKIIGNDKGNFRLLGLSDGTETGTYKTTGGGTIEKYKLTSAPVVTLNKVTKEYDGTPNVVYSRIPEENDIKKFVSATITVGGKEKKLGFDLVSSGYDNANVNSLDGETLTSINKATFKIKFSESNYDFNNYLTPDEDGNVYFTKVDENATITPRKIEVTLGSVLDNKDNHYVTKDYDAGTKVKQSINKDMFIFNTADVLEDDRGKVYLADAVSAVYEDKNAGDKKNVFYTLSLDGDDTIKGNYVLKNNTLTGEGDIQKVALKITDDTFDYVEKKYNGSDWVPITKDKIHLVGVKKDNGDYETINVENAIGTDGGDNTYKLVGKYDDANVKWKGNTDTEDFKGVRYSNLQNALESMTDGDGEKISTNYTIADTKYFAEAKEKGKIKAFSITLSATKNWTPVTREYNADTDITEVYDYTDGVKGNKLGMKDILKLTVKDKDDNPINIDYDAVAEFDKKDVSDKRVLKYEITSVTKKVSDNNGANYKLANDVYTELLNATLRSDDAADDADKVYHNITKRQLNASLQQNTDVTKVYGTTTSTDNFKLDADDAKVLAKDGYNVNDVIQKTATYKLNGVASEDATMDPQAYGGVNTNTLTIDYTLATTADANNYEVVTPTAQATGDIERRQVQVKLVNGTVDEKDYDATTKMADGTDKVTNPNNKRFIIDPASGSDYGLVDGESITVSGATAEFADEGNVNRAKDGTVKAQSVIFSDFTKEDDTGKASNYYITTKELKGSGVINPLEIGVAVKQAPSKTYDGNTKIVGDTYLANSNLDVDETNALALGQRVANSIAIDKVKSQYKDKNAGEGNKGYAYVINLSNPNYKLVLNDAYDENFASAKGGLQATIAGSDGTIKKRVVSVNKIADMTKAYDGTTASTENAVANVSLNNAVNGMNTGVLKGDDVKLSATAAYDNPNAGKSANSDELQKHKVKYTLNLSNPNYQLADDSQTVYGNGYITRQGLVVTVNPASMNAGEALPKFTGTVTGFISGDQNAYRDFVNGLSFRTEAGTATTSPGQYAVYGWYRGNKAGLAGINYTFTQDAANDTALTVNYVNNNTSNPDTKITPSSNIYNQISKDMNSGFGDNGAAAIEYKDKSGKVIARENIDSGEIHGNGMNIGNGDSSNPNKGMSNIGIAGGDIVNMEGADAASTANIEVSGDGTTVNLEIFSLDGDAQSADKNAAAEITNASDAAKPLTVDNNAEGEIAIKNAGDTNSVNGSIAITNNGQNLLEENKDKQEEQEKEGEIAIKSSDGQNEDEIELTVEGEGVNVA